MATIKKRNFLVVDLEATCDTYGVLQRSDMETIEIGAVKINHDGYYQTDSYCSFIRPVLNPVLSDYCKNLTSITQEDVNSAKEFRHAFGDFISWIGDVDDYEFCSWGDFDWIQLEIDCSRSNVKCSIPSIRRNLKEEFSEKIGRSKRYGMKSALSKCGLRLSGTHHRGIDDALNISRMIPFIIGNVPIRN